MFQVGDLVIYGGTGVCRVTEISERKSGDGSGDRLYYTMVPLYQQCVINTPVDNRKVFMRPVISKKEAEELICGIPSVQAEAFESKAVRELSEHYQASMQSYDCSELIAMTVSIYAKKQQAEAQKRKFGAVDEKYMKRAEEMLFGELAAALGIGRDDVPDYIASKVGAM